VIAFKHEPENPGNLKSAGVSAAMITAMLDRSTPSAPHLLHDR
jgi:hypothetical protein